MTECVDNVRTSYQNLLKKQSRVENDKQTEVLR